MINYKDIINNYKKSDNDCGSCEIQVILLSFRIKKLQEHLFNFKKDFHNRLSLLKLIFKRRKILKYIKLNNFNKYNNLLKDLNLRC